MDKIKTSGKSPAKAIALLLIGALGFAVALSWNDLFRSIMKRFTISGNDLDKSLKLNEIEADAQELDLFDDDVIDVLGNGNNIQNLDGGEASPDYLNINIYHRYPGDNRDNREDLLKRYKLRQKKLKKEREAEREKMRKALLERAKKNANQGIVISLIYAIIMTLILLGVGWFVYKKYPSII